MTPVEKTTPNPGHAHKGQIELGPATVTWAGDAAVQASEHSEVFFFGCKYQVSNPGWWAQPTTTTSNLISILGMSSNVPILYFFSY